MRLKMLLQTWNTGTLNHVKPEEPWKQMQSCCKLNRSDQRWREKKNLLLCCALVQWFSRIHVYRVLSRLQLGRAATWGAPTAPGGRVTWHRWLLNYRTGLCGVAKQKLSVSWLKPKTWSQTLILTFDTLKCIPIYPRTEGLQLGPWWDRGPCPGRCGTLPPISTPERTRAVEFNSSEGGWAWLQGKALGTGGCGIPAACTFYRQVRDRCGWGELGRVPCPALGVEGAHPLHNFKSFWGLQALEENTWQCSVFLLRATSKGFSGCKINLLLAKLATKVVAWAQRGYFGRDE